MKVGLLGPAAYAARVEASGWPVPPELCDPETAATSFRIQLDQFQLADELGFDWVSVSEHHFAPGLMTPNPIVLAAAASQRTERVRIAVLGPLMPLTNPVRVAEEIAMLDSISNGRVVVLPLRGTPKERTAYSTDGEPSASTREITQEGTRLMLKAWREHQPFSWRGEHFSFEHVSVWPRPLQDPHRARGGSDDHATRSEGAGYDPSSTDESPRSTAGEGGGAPGVAGFQFYGTPQTIVGQVEEYRDAGVGIIDVAFGGIAYGRGGTRKALNAFAEVLPEIQAM